MSDQERSLRKVKEGTVVSNKMEKTVKVSVDRTVQHPRYGKTVKRRTICYAHTDKPLNIGDKVTIMETRPLSKLKRWRVVA
ncbi:MAG: 30S ribosomal protein S17 [Chlamydiia bacterium]|nr:30S ribosomal protein S17 [Chlamydiia bacterium]